MQKILQGVEHFQHDVFPQHRHLFKQLANSQSPRALFITCSDSRILPNLITQTEPGELFLCRDVGNIVPAHGGAYGGVSATIEYSVAVLGVKHVIICGHSDCGAMRALLHPEKVKHLPSVYGWLSHAEAARHTVDHMHPDADEDTKLQALIEQNVVSQLTNLRTHPAVAARVATGALAVHGWKYSIETGEVNVYDEMLRRFVPACEKVKEYVGYVEREASPVELSR